MLGFHLKIIISTQHNLEIYVTGNHIFRRVVPLVETLVKIFSQDGRRKGQDKIFDPRDLKDNKDTGREVAVEEGRVLQELKLITAMPWLRIHGKNWKRNTKERKSNPADTFSLLF